MNKSLKFTIKFLIGLLILFFIFYKIGFKDIYETLIQVKFVFIPLFLFFYFFSFMLGSFNIKLLLNKIKKMNYFILTKYYLLSWSLGMVAPFKIGELSLIYFLKKENYPLGKGTAIIFLDKILTILGVFLISIFGFFVFYTIEQTIKLISIILLIFLIVLFFVFSSSGRELIKKFVLKKYEGKFEGFSKTLFKYFREYRKITLLNFILTFFKAFVSTISLYFLFLAFNTKIPIITILLIFAIVSVVSLIPITIGGIGVKEGVAIFLYNKIGVDSAITASVFLVFLVVSYLIVVSFLTFFSEDYLHIKFPIAK